MLNLQMRKSKPSNKRTIILLVSLIVVVVLSTVFILNNKPKTNSKSEKKIVNTKHKKSATKKSDNLDNKKAVKFAGEVAPWNIKRTDGKKMAYLTFDDGPSINTTSILQILDRNNIKANFFLIGPNAERYPELVKKESDDGEIIGNHTYSHDEKYFMKLPGELVNDLDKCDRILKHILGDKYNSELVRLPGGYMGHHRYNLVPFNDALVKAGYRYMDWNDETDDSHGYDPSAQYLLSQLTKNTVGKNVVVVLMHDAGAKKNTVLALQQVIDYLRSQGFSFDVVK